MAWAAFVLLLLFHLAQTGDYSEYDPDQSEEVTIPQFITEPLTLMVDEGDLIRLPCYVDNLGQFVLIWKKDSEIISVAEQIIEKRFSLETKNDGQTLVLGRAELGDEGVYTCQISTYKSTELKHHVQIKGLRDTAIMISTNATPTTGGLAPLLVFLACDCLSLAIAMASG